MKKKQAKKKPFPKALRRKVRRYPRRRRHLYLLNLRLEKYCEEQNISGELKKDLLNLAFTSQKDNSTDRYKEEYPKRAHAATALGKSGDKRAFLPLTWALKDLDGGVRTFAARALGELKDERAVKFLVQRMRMDEHHPVQIEAIKSLVQIQGRKAAEPLLSVLEDLNIDERARAEAAEALGELREKRAAPALVEILKTSSENMYLVLEGAAIEALGKISFSLVEGKALQRLKLADKFFMDWDLKGLMLYTIAVNRGIRSKCPLRSDDVRGRQYLQRMKEGLEDGVGDYTVEEIFEMLGLGKKPKKKG